MKSKILTFRNRFDILMEIRLSGVAKRLIWEIPVNSFYLRIYYPKVIRKVFFSDNNDLICFYFIESRQKELFPELNIVLVQRKLDKSSLRLRDLALGKEVFLGIGEISEMF